MDIKEGIMRTVINIIALVLAIALIACGVTVICTPIDGDANGDGKVNAADLTMMKRHIIGMYDMSFWQINRCDMNQNGRVDELDLVIVRNIILGR